MGLFWAAAVLMRCSVNLSNKRSQIPENRTDDGRIPFVFPFLHSKHLLGDDSEHGTVLDVRYTKKKQRKETF